MNDLLGKILNKYIAPLIEEQKALKNQLQVSEGKMQGLFKHIEEAEKRSIKQNVLDETYRETVNEQLIGFQEQLNGQQMQLAGQQEQLNGQQSQLAGQQEQLNGQQSQLAGQQEQLNQHQVFMNQASERVTDFQSQLSGQQMQLAGHQEQLNSQQSQLEGHQEQLSNHQWQLNDQNQKIVQTLQNTECDDFKRTYAQSGEDAIIAYILRFLQKPLESITYLDLGANHAKYLSNTYHFYELGAHGVLVEANPELIPELRRERVRDVVLNKVISFGDKKTADFYVLSGDGLSTMNLQEAERACMENPELKLMRKYCIETCRVNDILEDYFQEAPTIMSIDLEGIEQDILQSIDFNRWKPWIIILENIPYTPLLSIDCREYCGVDYLHSKGYTEYAFTGINSIFVLREIVNQFNHKRQKKLNRME